MKIIAKIHSPFKEKFSIPRQPGLTSIESVITLSPPYNRLEALVGLENFSHLWVIFLFHENSESDSTSLTVRPPRLGGNTKQGVFATRSPFRPNNIGLSLVKIKSIDKTSITVIGGDFLDGTPVIDLKPYIKEIECVPEAKSGRYLDLTNQKLDVIFECKIDDKLKQQVSEVLSLDPRPRFHQDGHKTYGSKFENYDVHWEVRDQTVYVQSLTELI